MKGYKAYNYHSYILESSETLSPHVLLNLVGGFDLWSCDISILKSNLSRAFMFSNHVFMIWTFIFSMKP
jgi:hypothetical protein